MSRILHPRTGAASGTTSTRDGDDWRDLAACLNVDPELFYPADWEREAARIDRVSDAKAVCARCTVQDACLNSALENDERHGVWGGLSEDDREGMRRRANRARATPRPPKPAAPAKLEPVTRPNCGTNGGYKEHTDHGERQCAACRNHKAAARAGRRSDAA